MSIEEIRAIQKNKQISAIGQRRSAESITRIGERDPLTGKFQVLDPDGGVSPQGVKVYNAQEQYGDRVLPFPRTDGTIALDSEKGSVIKPPTAFPHCPGYLYGQVFNCEVPKKKKGRIWVLYEYEGRLYVGAHKQSPEMVYDPIPPNIPMLSPNNPLSVVLSPVQIRENVATFREYGQIWGDGDGWEVSYGVRYPIPLVKFATTEGEKQYFFQSASTPQAPYNYGQYSGEYLGRGLFIPQYFYQEFVGSESGSRSWSNALADFNTTSNGSGSFQWNLSSAAYLMTFPEPFSTKTVLANSNVVTISQTIAFQDRTSSVWFHLNGRNAVASIIEERKEKILFSMTGFNGLFQSESSNQIFHNGSLGTSLMRNYKYNNPSVTFVDRRSEFPEHQDSERDYDVKVFEVFKKESIIDGRNTVVKVNGWGIPKGSFVIDACAWVP